MSDSRIDQVTVYASGARVRRIATVTAPGRVRLTGLPLALIDDSVTTAVVEGGAIVTAIRVSVDGPAPADAAEEQPADLRAAKLRLSTAQSELSRLEASLAASATVVVADDRDEAPAPWVKIVEARRGLVALHAARERRLRDQATAARRELRDAREALTALEDREARKTAARAPKLHELRKVVELELAGSGESTVRFEYRVLAARWAPTYVARLDGDQLALEVRAVVAQRAGEDWTDVALVLSTAEPEQFSPLPELHAQKIGRRQDAPGKKGFRAPPQGASALYADYQQRFGGGDEPVIAGPGSVVAGEENEDLDLGEQSWDEGSSSAKDAFLTPPSGSPMPPPAPKSRKMFALPDMARSAAPRGGFGGGGRPMAAMAPQAKPAPPEKVPQLDYSGLVMARPDSPRRGQLIPAPSDPQLAAIARELDSIAARLAVLPLPPGCRAEWSHAYDHAFVSDGRLDVPADGAWHSLALTASPGTAKIGHVAVPREQPDVFRVATIANPLAAPLLPGPIDVYDRGRFLIASRVDYTPPGGRFELGLGVDPQVKVARNTEFREEATGMLRGALRLHHSIAIEVENLSARPIELEVRERVPVTAQGDDDVEVTVGRVDPAWQPYAPEPESVHEGKLRGGWRWRMGVPPSAKRTLRAAYEIKIAGKHELVGGNRRES